MTQSHHHHKNTGRNGNLNIVFIITCIYTGMKNANKHTLRQEPNWVQILHNRGNGIGIKLSTWNFCRGYIKIVSSQVFAALLTA